MGLVYNVSTSAFLLSQYGVIEDKVWDRLTGEALTGSTRLASLETRAKKNRPNDPHWKTGPALFSALLPENFHYDNKGVYIKNGILVSGNITEGVVGPSTRSIVHMLFHHYGTQVGSQFLSEGQVLLDRFIEYIGFTVGYRDCAMPNSESKVKEIVKVEVEKTNEKIKNLAPLAGNKNKEIRDFYNMSVQAALDSVKTIGQQIIKDALPKTNAMKIMADSGSKGKDADIAQLIGITGQQFVRGNRPALHFNKEASVNGDSTGEGLRFLPYYDIQHEGRPEKILNRGFADRPLGKGMRPGQFVAHMMATRISLIDTAFGTASTGYTQHTITKALEDLRYAYNGTICNDQGNVIQYAGGNDSYEPTEMMEVKIPGFGNIWTPIDIPSLVNMLNDED